MDEARTVEVEAGGHSLLANEDTKQIRNSIDFEVHNHWSTLTNANDVALIFLSPPLNLTDYVQPIPLASVEPPVNAPVTAIGWGLTHDDPFATISDKLYKVTVPVEHDQVAADFYGDFYDWSTKICIDSTGGKGTCNVSFSSNAMTMTMANTIPMIKDGFLSRGMKKKLFLISVGGE